MELRTKKILMSIAFLGSVFLFGFLLYWFFFRAAPSEIVNENVNFPTGEFPTPGGNVNIPVGNLNVNRALPTANTNINAAVPPVSPVAAGGITKVQPIVSTPTKNATLAQNGRDLAYYDVKDNRFYKINTTGQMQKLSDKQFFNVQQVHWAKDVSRAVIEYPDQSKIMYDFKQDKQYTLPKHWEGFDFSPDGQQLVTKSMGIDPDNRWLAISNADGSQAQRVESLGENGDRVTPSWSPTNQIVATYVEGIDLNRQEVFFIGKNKENFKSAVIEGRGYEGEWSPTGSHLLYSVYNAESSYNPTLWITEANGDRIGSGRQPLEVNTWAHKCTFGSTTKVYCAVPNSLAEGSGLFPEVANTTPDSLYEIDLTSGVKRLLAIPEQQATMQNIMVAQDGRSLFYTDVNNGQIFKIDLK